MLIGERIRSLRVDRQLSQGDIEKRTGLLRCYLSRVENGHTVPSLETLEKIARAFAIPLYSLFYETEGSPPEPARKRGPKVSSRQAVFLRDLGELIPRMADRDRRLLLSLARKMAKLST